MTSFGSQSTHINDDGELHNPSGPAITWETGEWVWMYYDQGHRYYGPNSHLGNWYIHGGFTRDRS